MTATNTATLPESILTAAEQAWLDACPVGDSRSLTKTVGQVRQTATVDRRIAWGAAAPQPMLYGPRGTEIMPSIEPRWEIGLPGSPTWDSTGNPPLHIVTVTSQ
jgi:hypothetical protein